MWETPSVLVVRLRRFLPKEPLPLLLLISLLSLPTCSFGADTAPLSNAPPMLNFTNVLQKPSEFDGKQITLDCYYYEASEKVVLASKVIAHTNGWRSVVGGDVWVNWGIKPPKDLLARLHKLPGIGGEPDLYGRVQVTGIFRIASNSGHMGDYKYSFQIRELQVYDETAGGFYPIRKNTGETNNETNKQKPK